MVNKVLSKHGLYVPIRYSEEIVRIDYTVFASMADLKGFFILSKEATVKNFSLAEYLY